MRTIRAIAVVAAVTLLAPPGAGQPARTDTQACISSYEHAQELRVANRLKAAADELRVCANAGCPDQLRGDCVKWSAEVATALPTIVFVARDRAGRDVANVEVTIDGASDVHSIDGNALAVDPGPHRARFAPPGVAAIEIPFVAQTGEHDRPIKAVFDAPSAGPPPPAAPSAAPASAAHTPWAAIAIGAVGVVTLGAGVYVGASAKSDVDTLRSDCAPHCDQGDIDAARRRLHVADALMATGVVAIGVGTVLYFTRSSPDQAGAPRAATRIDVKSMQRGALLTLARSFW